MIYNKLTFGSAEAHLAVFIGNGRGEAHAIISTTLAGEPFAVQLASVLEAAGALRAVAGMDPVFKRYFLSDASNQASLLPSDEPCACSVIQQAPLDGSKVALWMVLERDADYRSAADGVWENSRGRMWMGDTAHTPADSCTMSVNVLEKLADILGSRGANLLDHCVRTWFLVRDVDVNYAGVVRGRNEVFGRHGLTRSTHFISSTGIEGRPADTADTVAFNALADLSIRPGQMSFVQGASHLNPTIEYGVAFERGTCVDYADRRHMYISGTASIDNRGEIVHPGDIAAQTGRMLENIEVLLAEGGCRWTDVAHLIVYLRDVADYAVVRSIFDERLPQIPRVIVQAPVCRPGWLIETECMAIANTHKPEYAEF